MQTALLKKDVIMMKEKNEVALLKYQIQRYQMRKNGVMCQQLKNKLHKLLANEA